MGSVKIDKDSKYYKFAMEGKDWRNSADVMDRALELLQTWDALLRLEATEGFAFDENHAQACESCAVLYQCLASLHRSRHKLHGRPMPDYLHDIFERLEDMWVHVAHTNNLVKDALSEDQWESTLATIKRLGKLA